MAGAAAPPRRKQVGSQGTAGAVERTAQWLHRAAHADGSERHSLTLLGKSTLVAGFAWFIAHDVLHAQTPAFAPFSAVLIMQITVYQSLLQALRYVAAVCAGVGLQGAFGAVAGPNMVSFVFVALVAVTIGRWSRLGSQGPQVATAAFFAFSTYAAAASQNQGLYELGQIVVLVLLGCGVGVVVNVLVLPPMRYRSAEHGIHALGQALYDLSCEISPALRDGKLDKERTRHWRQRATYLGPMVAQAQSSVRTAWESIHYHPRRLMHRHRPTFSGYQALVDALE
ncbi:MAG TPA: FUSC family protein, partial [Streptomyces sp.]|nr:FUSC family protein [Streptomyces sp.]